MKPETKFQKKVLADLKKLPKVWVLKTHEKVRRGVPDLLICACGHFVAIELKAHPGAAISDLQSYELGAINHSEGSAFVANPENWPAILNEIKNIIS
jgi:hypothetical protein